MRGRWRKSQKKDSNERLSSQKKRNIFLVLHLFSSLLSKSHRDELQLWENLLELPRTFLKEGLWSESSSKPSYTHTERSQALTSQVWLSRLTDAVFKPMMMANAVFKFLWALQLHTHKFKKANTSQGIDILMCLIHFCREYLCDLTELRSWWTS